MQAGGGGPTGPAAVWSKELAKLWLYSDFPHLGPSSSHAIWSRFAFDGVDCRLEQVDVPENTVTVGQLVSMLRQFQESHPELQAHVHSGVGGPQLAPGSYPGPSSAAAGAGAGREQAAHGWGDTRGVAAGGGAPPAGQAQGTDALARAVELAMLKPTLEPAVNAAMGRRVETQQEAGRAARVRDSELAAQSQQQRFVITARPGGQAPGEVSGAPVSITQLERLKQGGTLRGSTTIVDITNGQQTTLKALLSAAHERRTQVVSAAFEAAGADEAALDYLQRAEAATRWAEHAEKALQADILHRLWTYTTKPAGTAPDAAPTTAGPYNRIQLRMGFNTGSLPPYTELRSNTAQRCAVDGLGCPTSLPTRKMAIPDVLAAEAAAINTLTALWKEREAAVAAADALVRPVWNCAALPGLLTHLRDLRLRCRAGKLRRDVAVWRTEPDGSSTSGQPLHVALGAHGIQLPPPPQGGAPDQVLPPPLVWSPDASWSEASQHVVPPAATVAVQHAVAASTQPPATVSGAARPHSAARMPAVEVATAQEVSSAARSPGTASPGVPISATPVAADAGALSANTDVTAPVSTEGEEEAGQDPSGGQPQGQAQQSGSPVVAPAPDASHAAAAAPAAPPVVPEVQLPSEEPQVEAVLVCPGGAVELPTSAQEAARVDDGNDDDNDDLPFTVPESADLAWNNVGGILRMAEEANAFAAAVASAQATPVAKGSPPCASGAVEPRALALQLQDVPHDGVPETQEFGIALAEPGATAAPSPHLADQSAAAAAESDAPPPLAPAPKRPRGRPPGSGKKKLAAAAAAAAAAATAAAAAAPAAAPMEVLHCAEAPPAPASLQPSPPPPPVVEPMPDASPPPPPVADFMPAGGVSVSGVQSAAVPPPPPPVAAPVFTDLPDVPLHRDIFDIGLPSGSPLTLPAGLFLLEFEQMLATLTSPLPTLAPGAVPAQRLTYALNLPQVPAQTLTPGKEEATEPAPKRRRPTLASPPPPVPLESVPGVAMGLCADSALRQCPLAASSPEHGVWLTLACANRALTADEVGMIMAARLGGTSADAYALQGALTSIYSGHGLQQHFARVVHPSAPHGAYVAVLAAAPSAVATVLPGSNAQPLLPGVSERSLVGGIWRALDAAGPSGATVDWVRQWLLQAGGLGSAVSAATLTREIHASQDDGAGLFVGLGRGTFALARHAGVTATASPSCARANPCPGRAQLRSFVKGTCSTGGAAAAAPEPPVVVAAPAPALVGSASAQSPMFEVKRSGIQGLGVFAARPIARGERVVEYLGELITMAEADVREARYQKQRLADYMFMLDRRRNVVIDATRKGNVARLINHSCGPNCESRFETDAGGRKHIYIHALRDIPPGQELCYDYCFDRETDPAKRLPCRCGAAQCTGWMA